MGKQNEILHNNRIFLKCSVCKSVSLFLRPFVCVCNTFEFILDQCCCGFVCSPQTTFRFLDRLPASVEMEVFLGRTRNVGRYPGLFVCARSGRTYKII